MRTWSQPIVFRHMELATKTSVWQQQQQKLTGKKKNMLASKWNLFSSKRFHNYFHPNLYSPPRSCKKVITSAWREKKQWSVSPFANDMYLRYDQAPLKGYTVRKRARNVRVKSPLLLNQCHFLCCFQWFRNEEEQT